jgi:hypothetical protein
MMGIQFLYGPEILSLWSCPAEEPIEMPLFNGYRNKVAGAWSWLLMTINIELKDAWDHTPASLYICVLLCLVN